MQQDGRRKYFKVTTLFGVDGLSIPPNAHEVGKVVGAVLIICGCVEKRSGQLIEGMEGGEGHA